MKIQNIIIIVLGKIFIRFLGLEYKPYGDNLLNYYDKQILEILTKKVNQDIEEKFYLDLIKVL